jgi:hypothetical protein
LDQSFYSRSPRRRKLVLTQEGYPESRNWCLDAAATPPAEASSVCGATLSVWKEESVMLMRSRVWLARGGRGIARGEHQIVKAVQDKASPAALHRKTPEAQDLLLTGRLGALRRKPPEAHDAGSAYPCDGRAKAAAAIWELTESTKNKSNNSVRLGSIS